LAGRPAPRPSGRVELLAFIGALIVVAIPVALWVHAAAGVVETASVWPVLAAAPALLVAALLMVPRDPGPVRAAAAAATGAGVLVGIALALHAPAYWVSPDTAWHTAKVALAADGSALQDPILRVRTIYPFVYHWLLAWPVRAGVPLQDVMTLVSAVALSATCLSFWWAARARLDPVRAAWVALALPLFFHAPQRGYMLLPDPSNLSWALLFVGLGMVLRSESRPGTYAVLGGVSLGVAGLAWYGHLPYLALFALLLLVASPQLALRVVAGALPLAVVLGLHLLALPAGSGGGAIVGEGGDLLTERLAAMLRNVLGLSGGAAWAETPWWIGVVGAGALVYRWRFGAARAGIVLPRIALAVALCLCWAGLQLRYWEPFSWRYALVLWALLALVASDGRLLRPLGRRVPVMGVAAFLALALVPGWWLPVVWDSKRLSSLHAESGGAIEAFLESSTDAADPVFASVSTWEHVVGCCVPRPNLLDRDGGIYKYAPAELVEPRYRDYLAVVSTGSADEASAILAPYGFRYAVIHARDLERPGLAALARGFEPRVVTPEVLVVDLHAPLVPPSPP